MLPKFFNKAKAIRTHMDKALVKELIDGALAENPAVFLVDWSISPDNDIKVWVDGDDGVDLEEIIRISRAIEHSDRLDREAEDFSLLSFHPRSGRPAETQKAVREEHWQDFVRRDRFRRKGRRRTDGGRR